MECCLKIKTICPVFKPETEEHTFATLGSFNDKISVDIISLDLVKVIRCEPAGVCHTLYGQARVGLYWTFPEQHVRVLVFQLNLGTFTHRHLK